MVLGFGGQEKAAPPSKQEDVAALIAKKNYARAIEVIKKQLQTQRPDPRLRLQLADVLVLANKTKEAVIILQPLADEYAREGFAAKAISVLKRIQKIDPSQRGIDAKLAELIQDKQRLATVSAPAPSASGIEFGIEEIGFEPPPSAAPSRSAAPPPRAAPPRTTPPAHMAEDEPEAEISLAPPRRAPEPRPAPAPPVVKAAPPVAKAAPVAPRAPVPAPAPRAARPMPAPVEDRDLITDDAEISLDGGEGELSLADEPSAAAPEPEIAFAPEPERAPAEAEVAYAEPEIELTADIQIEPEAIGEAPAGDGMSESLFAEELLSLVEGAFKDAPGGFLSDDQGPAVAPAAAAAGGGASGGGAQIVVSPLFKDMSVDELVAVIAGLNLLTFEAGDIIITEGDPGSSMYMLTSGTVKALKKNAQGKQTKVGELSEGAFFGEISILTGQPRTATVLALTPCELLELDRPTLDSITQTHPRVWQILEEFSKERLAGHPPR